MILKLESESDLLSWESYRHGNNFSRISCGSRRRDERLLEIMIEAFITQIGRVKKQLSFSRRNLLELPWNKLGTREAVERRKAKSELHEAGSKSCRSHHRGGLLPY